MVDAGDLKSPDLLIVRVRVPPPAPLLVFAGGQRPCANLLALEMVTQSIRQNATAGIGHTLTLSRLARPSKNPASLRLKKLVARCPTRTHPSE